MKPTLTLLTALLLGPLDAIWGDAEPLRAGATMFYSSPLTI